MSEGVVFETVDNVTRRIDVGCRVNRILMVPPATVYAACEGGDVLTLAVSAGASLRTVARQSLDANVDTFFVHDGAVWAQTTHVQARRIGNVQPGATALPTPTLAMPSVTPPAVTQEAPPLRVESRAPGPPRTGHVIRTLPSGDVTVDLGADDGVTLDDDIELYVDHPAASGLDAALTGHQRLAVGRVVDLSSGSSRVRLGPNEAVPSSALAQRTHALATGSGLAPPRIDGSWDVGLALRPYLTLSNVTPGVLWEGWVTRRFELPVYVSAGFAPAGVQSTSRSSAFGSDTQAVGVFTARIEGGYDGRLFSVGVGVGSATYLANGSTSVGFALFQSVRLGALDGLQITVENAVVLADTQFQYAGLRIFAQVPVATGVWIVGRGGGSTSYAFGDLGLRLLVNGNGRAGSVFVTPSAGFSGITPPLNVGTTFGPMVGLLAEARF